MTDDILQRLNENKVKQELREFLANQNESSQFNNQETCDDIHKKVLDQYNSMDETQQQQFKGKQWIND